MPGFQYPSAALPVVKHEDPRMRDDRRTTPPSFWLDDVSESPALRPALDGDIDADVAIVGAGFTGLWTAYYLLLHDPNCRVTVIDAKSAGYGASGRNGGFCDGIVHGLACVLRRDRDGAIALWRALFDAVDEVGRVARERGLDFGYDKGGCLQIATERVHEESLKRGMEDLYELGFDDRDYRWLEPDQVASMAVLGGQPAAFYTPHAAAVQPARVARALATTIEGLGATVHEQTRALAIEAGCVRADRGSISADFIVNATEAYGVGLAGRRRSIVPLYNYMVATEPLPPSTWEQIGMRNRVTVADGFRDLIYLQRTADGRIAIGGRGSTYSYGSGITVRAEHNEHIFGVLHGELQRLFPSIDAKVAHRWGGVFGVPRDMTPSVGLDRDTGLAWAGGYVGSGVACANLAGRTVADLVLDRQTDRSRYPWVRAPSQRWEPEPLRWIGVSIMLRLVRLADWCDRHAPAGSGVLDRIIARIAPDWEIG